MLLNGQGFDLWADGYDKDVGLSDESGTYPFAGYREFLNHIYREVLRKKGADVLDIGFGTGTLTAKLYQNGCAVWGQDFSEKMIAIAGQKMPDARLCAGDFTKGLHPSLTERRYDAIVATYSLHHLTDAQKPPFLRSLLALLRDGGKIFIGDVAFRTREELERCRREAGGSWDPDEICFVYDELKEFFPALEFTPFSHCAGVLTLAK